MSNDVSHDHNFKDLIVEYPRDALALFAADEAPQTEDAARITPVRQERLKERLGDRFRELDTPLLVEWADGRREGDPVRPRGRVPRAKILDFTGWRNTAWTSP